MKKILCSILLISLMTMGLISCNKENTDAPEPVEGLVSHSGRNRAEVIFEVPGDAKSGKVFYGNGNFKEFTVTDPTAKQKVIVEELSEQEQTLRVVTMNQDGMVSNPRGIKVNVYGSNYESALKPRKWADQVTNSATSLQFLFSDAVAGETGVTVVYTNTSGAKDSVTMENVDNSIVVNNIDTSQHHYYYSVYKPEATAIDDFFSPSVDLRTALMLDFKKASWTIVESSGEDNAHVAANIIDNNSNTAWRSQSGEAMPQWVTIDMDNSKYIDGFYYINHPTNGSGPKSLKFEISQDNTSWTTILQTDVSESYFRQRLPLVKTVIARYIKVSVVETKSATATQTQIVEIDAYNVQNISADNGYLTSTAVSLINAKAPFAGDGSNPFPILGQFRMQKMLGWTHSANAVVTFDNAAKEFTFWSAAVWGLGAVTNGKVYQTVSLQPGHYILKVASGHGDGPLEIYSVVSTSATLPDYANVPTAPEILSYANLVENQRKTVEMRIIVTSTSNVHIGFVYNLRSQYSATGIPWTTFNIKGIDLAKVQ